eukprot:8114305-Alexandrium_andersonii.AAC.1
MLGPDQSPSGRGPALAGAGASRTEVTNRPRLSWADLTDARDEAQCAAAGSEPVPTGVAPHERQVLPEGDRLRQ